MKRRILAGMGANSFGMVITIGIQLVSLPLFLYFWDTKTYGTWLILSAIPSYLSMADVGMVSAAGNKMTMAMGEGNIKEANSIFQSAQLFMLMVCGSVASIAIPVVLWAPLHAAVNWDQRLAILAMCLGVLAALFGGLSEAVFKATGRYAIGTMYGNFVRLGEWLGWMIGLAVVGSFAAVAIAGLVVRLLGTFIVMVLAKSGDQGMRWGVKEANAKEIFGMTKPALSFMAFPLANALSFQGVTLLVGAVFGPVAVALFNTYRTIARVAVQLTAIFSHALWPEFSRLFGQGGMAAIASLYRRSAWLSAAQSLLLSVILYYLSAWLLRIWTHGEIEFIPRLMLIMLLYAAVAGIWHIPRVLLMATNQHVGLAYWVLISGVLSVGLSWLLSDAFHLEGVVIAMLISEFFIAIISAWFAYKAIAVDKKHGAIFQ